MVNYHYSEFQLTGKRDYELWLRMIRETALYYPSVWSYIDPTNDNPPKLRPPPRPTFSMVKRGATSDDFFTEFEHFLWRHYKKVYEIDLMKLENKLSQIDFLSSCVHNTVSRKINVRISHFPNLREKMIYLHRRYCPTHESRINWSIYNYRRLQRRPPSFQDVVTWAHRWRMVGKDMVKLRLAQEHQIVDDFIRAIVRFDHDLSRFWRMWMVERPGNKGLQSITQLLEDYQRFRQSAIC